MALSPGTTLGPYAVTAKIGEGGVGQVTEVLALRGLDIFAVVTRASGAGRVTCVKGADMNRVLNVTPRVAVSGGLVVLFGAALALGQGLVSQSSGDGRAIEFPDVADYQTLVVDLHTHTVFSDGQVWPSIRVGEARGATGLMPSPLPTTSNTNHILPTSRLATAIVRSRKPREWLKTRTCSSSPVREITRGAPVGHMNAVFVRDPNQLLRVREEVANTTEPRVYATDAGQWPAQQAVEAANHQGAFVFWNHAWSNFPSGIPVISDFHRENAAKGLVHGIEVANGSIYSEEAFQIALDHNLALIGVSDVHGLIDWDYEPHNGGHRPVTLVFATTRDSDAIREALFDQRTVVWFKNTLLGRPRDLLPLLDACLSLESVEYWRESDLLTVKITNTSDVEFELKNVRRHHVCRHIGSHPDSGAWCHGDPGQTGNEATED